MLTRTLSAFWFKCLLAALVISFIISCSTSRHAYIEKPLPEIKIGLGSNEVKLGDSKFYIIVPDNYKVIEARGKEGQHGFHLTLKNTSPQTYGFIEIAHGYPIFDSTENDCKNSKFYTQSILLHTQVTWTICNRGNKFFDVQTNVNKDIMAFAYSDKKNDIDSLISIIGTLSEKINHD
jgi:hypothetical protein